MSHGFDFPIEFSEVTPNPSIIFNVKRCNKEPYAIFLDSFDSFEEQLILLALFKQSVEICFNWLWCDEDGNVSDAPDLDSVRAFVERSK